ncbi:putative O-glycosylation ligase, exosortase A system-associated [Magnetococcus sp. PR-3]|uniref:putative O-glycosylation ligase, exosortase A system-associated n=1 Tax=Magnetococcus sp. PR-3 TaxID=3120355 RepID=UPI002FCE3FF8
MRDLILTLFIFGSLPYAFVRPKYGLMLWAMMSYMNPHRLTWSYAYDFRFNFFVALITLAGVIFNKEVKYRIPINGVTIFWILFCLWTVVTSYTSFNPGRAFGEFDRFFKIQLMVLITFFLIMDRKWLDYLVWVIVISIGVWVVKGGMFTILSGGQYRVYGPAQSFIGDNNAFALAVIMTLPLLFYLKSFARRLWERQVALALFILSVITVVGSYSRGGMLGLTVVITLLMGRTRRGMLSILVLVVFAGFFYTAMPGKWQERMDDFFEISTLYDMRNDFSMMGRLNSWVMAWELAKDRPIVGGGFNTFTTDRFKQYAPVPFERHDAHSIFFEVLAEQGFFGLTLFLFMHAFSIRMSLKTRRLCRRREELQWAVMLSSMLLISMVGYYMAGLFLGLAYFDLPYHLLSMMVILHQIVKKTIMKEEAKKEAESAVRSSIASMEFNKPNYSIFSRS